LRIRLAMTAALVALIAVVAGAQASDGSNGPQGPGTLAIGSPSGTHPLLRSETTQIEGRRTSRTHTATTVGADNYADVPDLSGGINGNSLCRFPRECFLNDEDTIGATLEPGFDAAPNNTCTFNSNTITYKSTVWYAFQAARDGILNLEVFGSGTGFVPLLFYGQDYFSGPTTCWLADAGSQHFGRTPDQFVNAGDVVVVGVASQSSGNDGTYSLGFQWDPDSDNDGTYDSDDRCDTQRGPASTRGCPDADGDHVADLDDLCDTAAGPASLGGCPDSDGDGLRDISDRCPTKSGKISGCPDADGDGNAEGINDACPGEGTTRDANNNGCQDLGKITAKWGFKPGSYFNRRTGKDLGLTIKKLAVSRLPRGARVTVSCTKRACKKKTKKAGKKGRVSFTKTKGIKGRKLKAGVKLTVRVSLAGFVGDARVYKIKPNDFSRKDFCLRPGSKKLRKSCPTVR
jgi:hypothetical protein